MKLENIEKIRAVYREYTVVKSRIRELEALLENYEKNNEINWEIYFGGGVELSSQDFPAFTDNLIKIVQDCLDYARVKEGELERKIKEL